MVRVRVRKVNEQVYYYLEHSIRKNGKVTKTEKYLGKRIPRNIEVLKRAMQVETYEERWFSEFENIKGNYARSQRSMNRSEKKMDLSELVINYTYNSQRLMGSKLTIRETTVLLNDELTPSNRPLRDVKEAEGHKHLFFEMFNHKKDLNLQTVLNWHEILMDSSRPDIAGRFRQHPVGISGSDYNPPMPIELDLLMSAFFKWYHKSKQSMHPVELAALVHLKFVTIHPFEVGSGRLARVLMNFILHKNGYPMFDIKYQNKNSYYNTLERSQKHNNDGIFVQWIFRNYIKANGRYLPL
jgi:Fic family protein